MLRCQHIFLCVLVSLLSLTLGACKNKQDQVVSDDLPDLSKQTRPYVIVELAKVRTGPGEQFKIIGEIRPNAKVNVVGRDGEWLLIVSKKGNAPGYIDKESAKPASAQRPRASLSRGRRDSQGHETQRRRRREGLAQSRVQARQKTGLRRRELGAPGGEKIGSVQRLEAFRFHP